MNPSTASHHLSPTMQRALVELAEEKRPVKLNSATYRALERRGLIFAEWEGETVLTRELRIQLTSLGWQVYREHYAMSGAVPDTPVVVEQVESLPRKRFILIVTFNDGETEDVLLQVEETIRYLRQHGWQVEERGI